MIIHAYGNTFELDDKSKFNVMPYTQFAQASNDIQNIKQAIYYQNWISQNKIIYSLGYNNHIHWIKLDIKNQQHKRIFLEYKINLIEKLNVYLVKNKKTIQEYKSGINKKFSSRPLHTNKFIFPLDLEQNTNYTIYLELSNKTFPNTVSFVLYNEKQLYKEQLNCNLITGILMGVLIIMFVYNFVLYFFTDFKPYVYYLIYIISVVILNITELGYGYMFFYPNSVVLNKLSIIFSELLFCFTLIFFILAILDQKKNLFLQKVIFSILFFVTILTIIQAFTVAFNLTYSHIFYILANVLTIILLLSITILILLEIKENNIMAKLIFFPWSIPLFSITIYIINRLSFFIDIDKMNIIVQFSFAIELMLMSLIIGYRFRIIEKQKSKLILENKNHELLLIRQSKLASVGKLLTHITHQWKQPLMRINACLLRIETKLKEIPSTLKKIEKDLDFIEAETNYMSQSIYTFRRYLHPEKTQTVELLQNIVHEVLEFHHIKEENINYIINSTHKNVTMKVYKEELKEVITIILNNAHDALKLNNNSNKEIIFEYGYNKNGKAFLSIENTGPHIKKENLSLIFDPYYSTKSNSLNDGIGLYIAQTIIESGMNKILTVENTSKGVKFSIEG